MGAAEAAHSGIPLNDGFGGLYFLFPNLFQARYPKRRSMFGSSASFTTSPDMQGYARSINEQYLSLQFMQPAEKQAVGFDCVNEFGALG